jgi:hypothetical protein
MIRKRRRVNTEALFSSETVIQICRRTLCDNIHGQSKGKDHPRTDHELFFFNVCHPEVFNTYINIRRCIKHNKTL